jgi:hypothetical protein
VACRTREIVKEILAEVLVMRRPHSTHISYALYDSENAGKDILAVTIRDLKFRRKWSMK